jgi:hypothetical protein
MSKKELVDKIHALRDALNSIADTVEDVLDETEGFDEEGNE